MSSNFISANREQQYLFPPSIQDWLPEEHLARFVVDIVSQLNLLPITEAYVGRGSRAYHPQILLSLLFYGYATVVYSSRKRELETYDTVAFRFISANTHPDHGYHYHFSKALSRSPQQCLYFVLGLTIAVAAFSLSIYFFAITPSSSVVIDE